MSKDGAALAADPSGTFIVVGGAKGRLTVYDCEEKTEYLAGSFVKAHEGAVGGAGLHMGAPAAIGPPLRLYAAETLVCGVESGFLILIVTVTSACFIPAIRAARMDPLKALREE